MNSDLFFLIFIIGLHIKYLTDFSLEPIEASFKCEPEKEGENPKYKTEFPNFYLCGVDRVNRATPQQSKQGAYRGRNHELC